MRTTVVLSVFVALITCTAIAGPEHLIKQKAKDLRDQNNARQGVPPSTPGVAPVQPQPQRAPAQTTTISPAYQSLMRFQAALAEIKAGATNNPALKQRLVRELTGAAQYKKPSAGSVDRLVTALYGAMAAKPLLPTGRAKLVQDIDAILNPAKYPMAKMPAIYEDAQTVLKSGGVPIAQAVEVNAALRLLGEEAK